jgi:Zinc carboxypeptidase
MTTEVAKARTDRTIHRSFNRDVGRPLIRLHQDQLETIGEIQHDEIKYPLYAVRIAATRRDRPTVFVSGGVHGDEPAGVYAALDFLEEIAPKFRSDFNFLVLPCVNPSGYEMDTLRSLSGANLNRQFDTKSIEPEIRVIEGWLIEQPCRFLVTFDFHETVPEYQGEGFTERDNPRACYLYETVHDHKKRIGKQLIKALPPTLEVCRWPTIYLDVNSDGVISYPEANRNSVYAQETTFEAFLLHHKTDHAFTTETPTGWSFEKRIETHLCWLETALRLLKG